MPFKEGAKVVLGGAKVVLGGAPCPPVEEIQCTLLGESRALGPALNLTFYSCNYLLDIVSQIWLVS